MLLLLTTIVQSYRYFAITFPIQPVHESPDSKTKNALKSSTRTDRRQVHPSHGCGGTCHSERMGLYGWISIHVLILHCLGIALYYHGKASWPEAHRLLEQEDSKSVRFSAAISAWLMQVISPCHGGFAARLLTCVGLRPPKPTSGVNPPSCSDMTGSHPMLH